ncbi:MAG: hypothetical protein HYY84_16185 [Deltaproteobacteria bacterium]|nr:hypothetical protein [Deltaproteobacteria bacterium]
MGAHCRESGVAGADAATALRCGVCGDELAAGVIACATCETLHHLSCWEFVGHCSVYGCDEFRGVTLASRTASPSATPSRPNGGALVPVAAPRLPAKSKEPVTSLVPSDNEAEKAVHLAVFNNIMLNYVATAETITPRAPKTSNVASFFALLGILAFWVDWRGAVVLLLLSAFINWISELGEG